MICHTQESKEGRWLQVSSNGWENLKLENSISEIQVADTDWESDDEASNVEVYFEDEEGEDKEEQQQKQQMQASAEVKPDAATSDWLPTWGRPEGTNTNIHFTVDPGNPAKGGLRNCFSTFWI